MAVVAAADACFVCTIYVVGTDSIVVVVCAAVVAVVAAADAVLLAQLI